MPGDEDGGGMSAFVVFSMMGLYPVTPGLPVYDLASPVFDRITIKLHNGKTFEIVCRDNSAANKYIQDIQFNGRPQTRVWIKHSDVLQGGKLELQMSDTPNPSLGSKPEDFPPSALVLDSRQFE
jgi:putative alpha-1,2-mannosidase